MELSTSAMLAGSVHSRAERSFPFSHGKSGILHAISERAVKGKQISKQLDLKCTSLTLSG